tara:strand:+ start:8810 stop:9481 length:672 start_codon:yes stop_codon:yes gene_type:complete
MNNYKKICEDISYNFKNVEFLDQALTHSIQNTTKKNQFQRLEFLGDRILGIIIADILYNKFKNETEGDLTRRLHNLVCEEAIARVSRDINLDKYINLSQSENKDGGRMKDTILSDACEAIIAAIYIDGGYVSAFSFVKKHWKKYINKDIVPPIDPKTKLQEWAQSKGYDLPIYEEIDRSGPDHDPIFIIKVKVGENIHAEGSGASKKQAERAAAENLLANSLR